MLFARPNFYYKKVDSKLVLKISIHAPYTGCDIIIAIISVYHDNFNPRTPRGVRLLPRLHTRQGRHFNPRTLRGVRP